MDAGALQSVPKLPAAPQLTAPSKADPSKAVSTAPLRAEPSKAVSAAKSIPAKAQAAVKEVQNGANQTVEAPSGNPIVAVVGVLAAALGLGGYKVFSGKQGKVASEPKKFARQAQASRYLQCPHSHLA
jgi:uncharacterized protein HemX